MEESKAPGANSAARALGTASFQQGRDRMPIALRTRVFRISKWFPPNDVLAAKIARLCILRQDFLLEMNGVLTEQIKDLDCHSEEWRRLYFVRNLIRTLREIEAGMQRVLSDPEFAVHLAGQGPAVRKQFAEHTASMAKGIGVLKEVRDDICGHVQEGPIRETLNELADSDLCGILETGPTLQSTYYKFAGELVIQILVRGVPDSEKHQVFMEKLEKIANLVQAFALIDRVLDIYMEKRNLRLRQQR